MARVSRRNTAQSNTLHNTAPALSRISTALYARLSVEQNDNDTIETQIAFLKNYVSERNEFTVFNIYMDHGYTGTDFDRPGFKKMMDEREIDIKKLIDNNQIDLDRLSKLNYKL